MRDSVPDRRVTPVGVADSAPSPRPPGPRGDRWAGCLEEYERDRLGFLLAVRDQYGGLVAFDGNTTIVNDPELASLVLNGHRTYAILGNFLNRRLSPAEAATRDSGRRHLNAGLRRSAVEGLGSRTEDAVHAAFGRALAARSSGHRVGAVDPLPLLEDAISGVIAGYYFGAAARSRIVAATGALLDALSRVFGSPFALPMGCPTPANLRIRRAYTSLHRMVEQLVRQRVDDPAHDDFAATVTRSATAAGCESGRVADLLIGSLLAAQRVPAAAASWALYELARSPAWAAEARADEAVLRAVVVEAGRLHPPTWQLRRVSTAPVDLGGHRFPAGHNFLVSPYVIHRDHTLFAHADAFQPTRWLDGSADPRALLTFGRGLHRCPGRDASDVVLDAAVGTLVRSYDLADVSTRLLAQPRTTLVPEGLALTFRARTAAVEPTSGRGGRRPEALDPLGETLPGGLAGDAHRLADLCPRQLA